VKTAGEPKKLLHETEKNLLDVLDKVHEIINESIDHTRFPTLSD
jgi:hypothetical protein